MSNNLKTPLQVFKHTLEIWGKASPAELSSYYADDVVFIEASSPQPMVGQALAWFTNAAENFPPFTTKLLKTTELAENALYFELLVTFNPPNQPQSHILLRSTTIWKQFDGAWKIIHDQWDTNPCDETGQRLTQ